MNRAGSSHPQPERPGLDFPPPSLARRRAPWTATRLSACKALAARSRVRDRPETRAVSRCLPPCSSVESRISKALASGESRRHDALRACPSSRPTSS